VKFARYTFAIAGIYGLVVLLPMYFFEARIGRDEPPPITHPEFFYGFVGVAVAWQVLFLIIACDPVRLRPAMLAAVLEKASFLGATIALFALGRLSGTMLAAGVLDGLWGAAFIAAWLRTLRD
jgi:hypothetical protein